MKLKRGLGHLFAVTLPGSAPLFPGTALLEKLLWPLRALEGSYLLSALLPENPGLVPGRAGVFALR